MCIADKMECGRRLALALMALLPPSLGKRTHNTRNEPETAWSGGEGPSITNVSVVQNGAVVELTIANGQGLHWNGTKQVRSPKLTVALSQSSYILMTYRVVGTSAPAAAASPAGSETELASRTAT